MDFKVLILCLAFSMVTASASSFCKCAQDEPKDTVSKYTIKMKEGNTEIDETIDIDTEKETESFHIPSNGDASESGTGDVDVVVDFKLKMTMQRLSKQNACFLSNSTEDLPKPADLNKLLEIESSQSVTQLQTPLKRFSYMAAGTVDDRSFLSDEMAHLCAKLPIYRLTAIRQDEKEKQLRRRKRCSIVVRYYCYWICHCSYSFCCSRRCIKIYTVIC